MKKAVFVLLILACVTCAVASPRGDRVGVFSSGETPFEEVGAPSNLFFPQGQDTIYYDDGNGFWYSSVGAEWGVRFSAYVPCTLHSVMTMTFGFSDYCTLYVREDSAGLPGPVVRDTAYLGGAYPGWDRIDLDAPYYDMNSFWITGWFSKPPYIVADSANDGMRSHYSFDGQTWLPYSSGDLMIRAVVAYGDTIANDVSIVSMDGIPAGVIADSQYTGTVYFANLGTDFESFSVEFEARDSAGVVEFDTLVQIDSLPPRLVDMRVFIWTPRSYGESYRVRASALHPGDLNPGNDTVLATVHSYMDGELFYDDFTSEVWLNVDMDDNDKFAVMYQPEETPYYVSGARLFVNDTLPFAGLALCPDSGGVPDTTNPYTQISGVKAAAPGSWLWFSFDTSQTRIDADTVWLVLTWPDSRAGPHIGSDTDDPIDGFCWAYCDTNGWVNWTGSDFLIRIVCSPATGVLEMVDVGTGGVAGLRAWPNPFLSPTRITLAGRQGFEPEDAVNGSLVALDASGRCVRIFSDSDLKALLTGSGLSWDGTGAEGQTLPPGVYFLILRLGGPPMTTKAVLLR